MNNSERSHFRVVIIFIIFFVISLLTNIIGPLVPEVIKSFQLSLTLASFLPFSFFVAYAILSVPSGIMIEKWGEKPILIGAFFLAFFGSLLFSVNPQFSTSILSLFLIGLGMAALQVAINPLLRVSGGEEHFAFNSVLAQLVFGLASFLSPMIYSYFATINSSDPLGTFIIERIPKDIPWIAVYWVFSVICILMILMLFMISIPRVKRTEDEKTGAWDTHQELLKNPVVILYFLVIFAYVGIEQGLANWMSEFLSQNHGFNPQTDGATAISRFWGLMTAGCALGLLLLKFLDSRKVLLGFSILSFVVLSMALFGSKSIAIYAFPAMGFAISVMWSILFSLALNSLAKHHGTFSGILCTGIVGGALVPFFIGLIGDRIGLRFGLCFLYLPLSFIFSVSFWAKPLVANKTV